MYWNSQQFMFFIFGVISLVFSAYLLRKSYLRRIERKKAREDAFYRMKREIVPVQMVMVDVLVYRKRKNDSVIYYCYPIMRDLSDGRLYVSFDKYSYGGYLCRCFEKLLPNQDFKAMIYSASGREVNFGEVANCYINRKLGTLSSHGKSILIDDYGYQYHGMTKDINMFSIGLGSGIFFNVTDDNFLNTVNNIILFEGIIDFDV